LSVLEANLDFERFHITKIKPGIAMRYAPALLLLLLSTACRGPSTAPGTDTSSTGTRTPQTENVSRYSIEEFMATTRIGGASFSPDRRKLLFHSNETGVFNVYEISGTRGMAS
jgi:hypothetical protein